MANEIVSDKGLEIQHSLNVVLGQIRMAKSYVDQHIDHSKSGPNEGNAIFDLTNSFDAMIELLNDVYNKVDDLRLGATD